MGQCCPNSTSSKDVKPLNDPLLGKDNEDAPKVKQSPLGSGARRSTKEQIKSLQKNSNGKNAQGFSSTPDDSRNFNMPTDNSNAGNYKLSDFIRHRVKPS